MEALYSVQLEKDGYSDKAVVINSDDEIEFPPGLKMSSDKFGVYPEGARLLASYKKTVTGRRMLVSVAPIKEGRSLTDIWEAIGKPREIPDFVWKIKEGSSLLIDEDKEKGIGTTFTPKVSITGTFKMAKVEEPREEPQNMNSNGYYIDAESRLIFSTAYQMSKKRPNRAVKLMVVGQSGFGKTLMPRLFAEMTDMAFTRMNCASVRDPEEWFGYREARDGSTQFIRTEFIKLVEKGNVVVLLDEFNRLEPWLTNTLFPLLDDDGFTYVHDELFKVGPNVVVVATINRGYKYTGTFEMDEALLNRFDLFLEVNAMPRTEEEKVLMVQCGVSLDTSSKVVKMANMLREKDVVCSTRSTLAIGHLIQAGMTIREAFETSVITRIPEDVGGNNLRKSMLDLVNAELGHLSKRKVDFDVFSGVASEAIIEDSPTINHTSDYLCNFFLKDGVVKSPDGAYFPLISIVKVLRTIDFITGKLSLKQAKDMTEAMRKGDYVSGTVVWDADIDTYIQELERYGVSLEYTR